MPFQHGNKAAKNADHRRSRLITQQLISALHEPAGEGDVTKLRKVVDKLIAKAIEGEGDVAAIKEIFDRVDGKSPQGAFARWVPVVTVRGR